MICLQKLYADLFDKNGNRKCWYDVVESEEQRMRSLYSRTRGWEYPMDMAARRLDTYQRLEEICMGTREAYSNGWSSFLKIRQSYSRYIKKFGINEAVETLSLSSASKKSLVKQDGYSPNIPLFLANQDVNGLVVSKSDLEKRFSEDHIYTDTGLYWDTNVYEKRKWQQGDIKWDFFHDAKCLLNLKELTYVIQQQSMNIYKIGKTTNMFKRYKQFLTGNPFVEFKFLTTKSENDVHLFLNKIGASWRSEWFKINHDKMLKFKNYLGDSNIY